MDTKVTVRYSTYLVSLTPSGRYALVMVRVKGTFGKYFRHAGRPSETRKGPRGPRPSYVPCRSITGDRRHDPDPTTRLACRPLDDRPHRDDRRAAPPRLSPRQKWSAVTSPRPAAGWSLGPCSSREAQEALRALLQELIYLDDRGVWRVGLQGDCDVSDMVRPALAWGTMTTRQSRRRARVLSAGGMQLSVLLGREGGRHARRGAGAHR